MTTFGRLLRSWRRHNNNMTQDELAELSNVARQTISALEAEDESHSRGPRQSTIDKIVGSFDVSVAEFWTGPPPMSSPSDSSLDRQVSGDHGTAPDGQIRFRVVPILSPLPRSRPTDEELEQAIQIPTWERLVWPRRPWSVLVPDDDMYSELRKGDIMIIDETSRPRIGSIVLATVNGTPMIRRFTKSEGERMLEAANASIPPVPLDDESIEVEIIGVYDGLYRPSRRVWRGIRDELTLNS